jgi:hypothetical protein
MHDQPTPSPPPPPPPPLLGGAAEAVGNEGRAMGGKVPGWDYGWGGTWGYGRGWGVGHLEMYR